MKVDGGDGACYGDDDEGEVLEAMRFREMSSREATYQ